MCEIANGLYDKEIHFRFYGRTIKAGKFTSLKTLNVQHYFTLKNAYIIIINIKTSNATL